jgi:heme/copper-type cytochrome/quinol oxidase subunit 2
VNFLGVVLPFNDTMASITVLYADNFGILIFIFFMIVSLIYVSIVLFSGTRFKHKIQFTKDKEMLLDIIFLFFPTLCIIYMLVPTLGFIYNNEFSQMDPFMYLNVIGHQWYWTYEYYDTICVLPGFFDRDFDLNVLQIDSFMETDDSANRLLEVTNRLVIPCGYSVGLNITSEDVIHSFALPQFGLKVDAVPGKIAQSILFVPNVGVYRGQCSELCGVYHGFMPIVLESVQFEQWYDFVCSLFKVSPATLLLNTLDPFSDILKLIELFPYDTRRDTYYMYSPEIGIYINVFELYPEMEVMSAMFYMMFELNRIMVLNYDN